MAVPIVYDRIIDVCSELDEAERVEIDSVSRALAALGYRTFPLPVDLSVDKSTFRDLDPRFVFNCIDTLDESCRFAHFVPSILDELGIPYTGSNADAIYLTSNKVLTKRFLEAHGVRTPRWCSIEEAAEGPEAFDRRFIFKHVWEDASFGLDERSVISRKAELGERISGLGPGRAGDFFLEAFVDGREFNVSLIAGEGGPRALPPMEIEFHDFPEGRPKIVDYKTKWETASSSDTRVERRFDFPSDTAPLLRELTEISLRCWNLFRLDGYARVDFRVDSDGVPWVLEINTNPYLGNDSSFVAATAKAGLTFEDVIRILVDAALRRPCELGLGR